MIGCCWHIRKGKPECICGFSHCTCSSWVCDKNRKERTSPDTENNLSGIVSGFGELLSALLGGTSGHVQELPCTFPPGKICTVHVVPLVARTDGICHLGDPSRPPPHGIPTVGGLVWAESCASWRKASDGHSRVCHGFVSLPCPWLPERGGPDGLGSVQEGDYHGRQPLGLGWNSRGAVCEGPLERRARAVSHKLPFFRPSRDIMSWLGRTTRRQ